MSRTSEAAMIARLASSRRGMRCADFAASLIYNKLGWLNTAGDEVESSGRE